MQQLKNQARSANPASLDYLFSQLRERLLIADYATVLVKESPDNIFSQIASYLATRGDLHHFTTKTTPLSGSGCSVLKQDCLQQPKWRENQRVRHRRQLKLPLTRAQCCQDKMSSTIQPISALNSAHPGDIPLPHCTLLQNSFLQKHPFH